MATAAEAKAEGNDHFRKDNFDEALACYVKALELDPSEASIYSNMAACYAGKDDWAGSLTQAIMAVKLKPDWPKGYFRMAQALLKLERNIEARCCCAKGLELDPANKEMAAIKEKCQLAIGNYFSDTCKVNFYKDTVPNKAFREVWKGKVPKEVNDANANDCFEKSQRTMGHIAVLMQHHKAIQELLTKGAKFDKEDKMGLTALHLAALIQNDKVDAALGELLQLQPKSTIHNSVPLDIARIVSLFENQPASIRVLEKGATALTAYDRSTIMNKLEKFYITCSKLTDEYLNCVLSSVLDEEGLATFNKEETKHLMEAAYNSVGDENLVLGWIDDEVGWGIFAAKDFKAGDFISTLIGVVRNQNTIKSAAVRAAPKAAGDKEFRDKVHAAQDSNVFVLQQSFARTAKGHAIPVCLDTTLFRSMSAYVNHDDEPNANIEAVVCRSAPTIVLVAARDVQKGQQICVNYRSCVHSNWTGANIKDMKPQLAAGSEMPTMLPAAVIASLP
jgi:tetratricopeptide (TPR) repeat protein